MTRLYVCCVSRSIIKYHSREIDNFNITSFQILCSVQEPITILIQNGLTKLCKKETVHYLIDLQFAMEVFLNSCNSVHVVWLRRGARCRNMLTVRLSTKIYAAQAANYTLLAVRWANSHARMMHTGFWDSVLPPESRHHFTSVVISAFHLSRPFRRTFFWVHSEPVKCNATGSRFYAYAHRKTIFRCGNNNCLKGRLSELSCTIYCVPGKKFRGCRITPVEHFAIYVTTDDQLRTV